MKQHPGIRLFLVAVLLFLSILPSLHAAGHFVHELHQTHCQHEYSDGKAEISHSHHADDCSGCEYRLSPLASVPQIISADIVGHTFNNPDFFFFAGAKPQSASAGILLRGPPVVA